jgi:putative selenate reductase
MTRHGLDVVVKLNPTLLGFDRVRGVVVDELGYDEIRLRPADFDADLQFARGVDLIGELAAFATEHGRRFGIKLTNTLVVENHKGFMPDPTMYLSGPPLHVVSMTLLEALLEALPGRLAVDGGDIQVSWSAGITKENLPDAAGLGLMPITICSDLLKPGGYGRLKPMLTNLQREMEAAGAADLAGWRRHVSGPAAGRPVHAYVARLHDAQHNGAYRKDGNLKLPRAIDHELQMWGCVACNFCVTVCPNDAFFKLPTPDELDVDGRQQYFVLTELCNECGNCMVFCPEIGDPAHVKPRLFTDIERFESTPIAGFLVSLQAGRVAVIAGPGLEEEVERLEAILNAAEGLPLAPMTP